MKVVQLYADTADGVAKSKALFEVFTSGQQIDQEQLQIRRKDGAVTWVSLSVNPIAGADGNIVESRSVYTDITALKKAETDIRNSEERFRLLAESAPVGIFRTDATGAVVYVNEACCVLTGHPREALLGDGWRQVLHPSDAERVLSLWGQSVETGAPFDAEFRCLKAGGGEAWVLARVESERDASGKVTGLLASVTDITAIKLAEAAARQSERRFTRILESLPDVIVLYDRDLRILYINPATRAVSGREPSAFIGKRDADIWPRKVYETYLPALKKARDSGETQSVNTVLQLAKDDPRTLEITCVPILNGDGNVYQVMGITHDLTGIRRAEADLAESENRFSRTMAAVNEGLWDWNLQTNHVYFSLPWKRLLGYEDSEIANEFNEFERRIHPDDLAAALADVNACIENPEIPLEAEFRMRHKNGNWVDILSRGTVMTDDAGNSIRFVGTHIDITERKAKERENRHLLAIRETISQCNSALVRIVEEDKLNQKMCDILVKTRDYALAWIGYANDDADKTISVQAAAGDAVGYLEDFNVHWGDEALGHGPTGTAIRTGEVQVVADLQTNPAFAPWREKAEKWGFLTSVALPLLGGDRAFGALNIYSRTAGTFDDDEIKVLKEFSEDLAFGIRMIRTGQERDQAREKLSEAFLETIRAIAMTAEKRDPYTAGHQRRVAGLAAKIARKLRWDQDRIEGLRLGATIHDIGKIYLPGEILNRPGKLSQPEFDLIKTHTEVGREIMAGVHFPWPVCEMIAQHHERLDGTGYPLGLKGDAIVEEAKIIAVADVVEAITSHRPYRPALGIEVAVEEIKRGRGTAYGPAIADACLEIVQDDGFQWDE